MVKVDPELYRKHVRINIKWNYILYMKMHKDIYGLSRDILLFYKNSTSNLEVYFFVINPYNCYIANMETNGSHMTVVWHFRYLKVSHKDSFEATRLALYLTNIYGGMKVNHGKVQEYLGMKLY